MGVFGMSRNRPVRAAPIDPKIFYWLGWKKRVFPAFLALLGHFCDVERILKNSGFPGARPGQLVVRQVSTTPLPHPRRPRQGPSEDVFGCI